MSIITMGACTHLLFFRKRSAATNDRRKGSQLVCEDLNCLSLCVLFAIQIHSNWGSIGSATGLCTSFAVGWDRPELDAILVCNDDIPQHRKIR